MSPYNSCRYFVPLRVMDVVRNLVRTRGMCFTHEATPHGQPCQTLL